MICVKKNLASVLQDASLLDPRSPQPLSFANARRGHSACQKLHSRSETAYSKLRPREHACARGSPSIHPAAPKQIQPPLAVAAVEIDRIGASAPSPRREINRIRAKMSTPELQALHDALTALTQLERGKAVSQTKVRAVAKACVAARDEYKLAVHQVEQFVKTAPAHCRLAGVYVIDAVCH